MGIVFSICLVTETLIFAIPAVIVVNLIDATVIVFIVIDCRRRVFELFCER